MRIAYIVPGTGGAFYCENCIRDCSMIAGFRALGHEVVTIPLYLPLRLEEGVSASDAPIFFGAMGLYLKQKFPHLRSLPQSVVGLLDSSVMLKIAASMAGSTRASGHEEMTLSMLQGRNGPLTSEFGKLTEWMLSEIRPDAVFISNLLLAGIGDALRARSDVPVACCAQDEHTWVDLCRAEYRAALWAEMKRCSEAIDTVLSFSSWYRDKVVSSSGIAVEKIKVIPFGVNPGQYQRASYDRNRPRIGFLSRISRGNGVDTLLDAVKLLRSTEGLSRLTVALCGGYTHDDKHDLRELVGRGRHDRWIQMTPEIGLSQRRVFLSSLSLLSTPVQGEIALGSFLFEAMAAGVPVVQPDEGGFPEVIRTTGGGITYSPHNAGALAEALQRLLRDNETLMELSRNARESIERSFNHLSMAKAALGALEESGSVLVNTPHIKTVGTINAV